MKSASGHARDEYAQLASQWPILADIAAREEQQRN